MSKLTPELNKQIEQEAKDKYPFCWTKNKHGEDIVQRVGQNPNGWGKHQKVVNAYKDGATIYALKWQEAEQKAERYEKTLKEIQAKAERGIFPHLPVETMGAQMCIEIEKIAVEAITPKQTTDDQENNPK